MREIEPPFEITSGDLTLNVSEHRINNTAVFHIIFSDKRKPLNITIAENSDGQKFWTSTPEGRQAEAENLGKLVANYIRKKERSSKMCYYNGQKVTRAEFIRLKNLEKAVRKYNFLNVGVHNGFMFQPAALAIANADKTDFELVQGQWGYMPYGISSHKEAQEFLRLYTTMNFKAENMLVNEKGRRSMWADAVEKGRTCLVLSTGMVENRHINKIGKKGEILKATDAYPYMVTMKDLEYWWLPGLYNQVLDKETGELVYTFAFATTKANALFRQIHNKDNKWRMPAILNENLAWEWLMTNPGKERLLEIARTQVPSKDMEYCTITKEYLTDRVANPTDYQTLPPIDMTYMDVEEDLLYPAA